MQSFAFTDVPFPDLKVRIGTQDVAQCRYGFIPTLQPTSNFGRLYAIYGGFFIVLSYGWGWVVDGEKPDRGDFIGAGIAIVGVALAYFWPRHGVSQ